MIGHKVSSLNGHSWSKALDAHPFTSISQHNIHGSMNDDNTLRNTQLNSTRIDPSRSVQPSFVSDGHISTWTTQTPNSINIPSTINQGTTTDKPSVKRNPSTKSVHFPTDNDEWDQN